MAGAARVSITPDPKAMPYTLGGYGDPQRFKNKATGIHDACYARALALSRGDTKCVMVSLDLCFLPASLKEMVALRMGTNGIKGDSIFLSATHTHSAPDPLLMHDGNTGTVGELPQYDPKLTNWIADRIAESITESVRNMRPAKIGSGQLDHIGLNRNRRGEMITDDQMTLLKVLDPEDKPIAIVINYAAHPTYYGPSMLEVSGDWSGAFERMVEGIMPGAVVLFINGAEGDASPNGSDAGTPNEKIEIYAIKMIQATRPLYESVSVQSDVKLAIWNQEIQLGARQPNPLFLLAASALKATPQQARAFVDKMMPEKCRATFLRVGDALFMGVPGEPTAPVGLEAKKMARAKGVKHPAIVALTNGWLGYLVTETQYKAGKYEPTMSFYGPSIGAKILAGIRAGLEGY